jgi:hypothetical protein
MGVDIDKLTAKASGSLHPGEEFKARTAGKIAIPAESGEHIVRGFIGATEHRVIVLINPTFDPDQFSEFALTEVGIPQFDKDANRFYLIAASQHFDLTDVLAYPDPNELVKFIKNKKTVEKTTFEATNLTIPAKK